MLVRCPKRGHIAQHRPMEGAAGADPPADSIDTACLIDGGPVQARAPLPSAFACRGGNHYPWLSLSRPMHHALQGCRWGLSHRRAASHGARNGLTGAEDQWNGDSLIAAVIYGDRVVWDMMGTGVCAGVRAYDWVVGGLNLARGAEGRGLGVPYEPPHAPRL
jgi:hypothetical protein